MAVSCEVLGTERFESNDFISRVREIHVPQHHVLTFCMIDGTEIAKTWQPKKQGVKEKGLPDQESLPPLPQPSVIPAAGSKMSEGEKKLIAELRSMGYEYKRIAAALGRPVSTIRTHCIYRPILVAARINSYINQQD